MDTMQLILTQPTTKDINIKMSTQTESLINGDVNEISQTFEANMETVGIEKTLSSKTDLPVPDITKDIKLEEEESLHTGTNGNQSHIPIDNIKECDRIENINSNVSENIINGIHNKNLDMTNSDDLAANKIIGSECCLPSNSSKPLEPLPELEEISGSIRKTDDFLSENIKTLPDDISNTSASVNINVSIKNLVSDQIDADNFTMDEKINKPSDVNKEACGSDVQKLNDETKHVELTISDSKYPDGVVVNEENKMSQGSENTVTNNEPNALVNEEHIELALLDNEDIVTHEIYEVGGENAILSETKHPNLLKMEEKVFPSVQNTENDAPEATNLEPDKMDEEEFQPLQIGNNGISTHEEDFEPLEIDDEVALPVQALENIILSETKTLEPSIAEEKSLSHQEISISEICAEKDKNKEQPHDATMTEPLALSVNVVADNINESKEIQESDASLGNSSQSCEENEVLDDGENKGDGSMDIDDIATIDLKTDNVEENLNNKSDISNEIVNKESIIEDTTEVKTSNPAAEQKVMESIVSSKDPDSDRVKDETKSEVRSEKNVEKEANEDVPTIKNLENAEPSIAILEKENACEHLIDNEVNDVTQENQEKIEIIDEDEAEVEVRSDKNKDKEPTDNKLTILNLENSEKKIPIAIVENKNACVDSIESEITKDVTKDDQEKIEIIDEDDVKIVDLDDEKIRPQRKENSPEPQVMKALPVVCKLSNTLDILSDDDEEEPSNIATNQSHNSPEQKQCINIDDDDDIMLIEEDSNSKDKIDVLSDKEESEPNKSDVETRKDMHDITETFPTTIEQDTSQQNISSMELDSVPEPEIKREREVHPVEMTQPLLPPNFLKTAKKNLAGMSRHELEEFCILRIVESIIDRSNLSDFKTKMKTMSQTLDDFKKRAMIMSKQNRDLQVVMKSVQEEQRKQTDVIQPLKITRSVGMQVVTGADSRRKAPIPNPAAAPVGPTGRPVRGVQLAKQIKPPATPANIPVPRKVPVNNSPAKAITNTPANVTGNKSANPLSNGLRNPSPVQKAPEKRPHSRMQTTSVTVDLTDDEPPSKISTKSSPQPVRVVPPQNLLAQQRQFPPLNNNARKVYIPISGPQAQQIRAGQALVMKNMVNPMVRTSPRAPMPRTQQQNPIRPKQPAPRHPAPLPESMKQYTPPTWKALPPAPDLKLSKVENGIVISWKIDGYPESGYETIASYQLYAYQETTAPPCTALWKKIGDVKALPLPMACTLTQFMAGFKYYFAVRAVDVRSRLGPFSIPGSILLLNKV